MRLKAVAALLFFLTGCSASIAPPPSTFIIFFNANSISLTPEAVVLIDQASTVIRQSRPTTVAIAAGVAAGSNLRLAAPRYAAVRQALEARGVTPSQIAQASLPRTGAEVNETGNQRVEIILGKGNK